MAFSWEQRKLGELCNITTGKLDANAMVSDGQYDFYTSGIDVFKIDVAAFEGPAITIAGNGASVGYMHLADGKFNAYQRTYVLTDFLADRQFLNVAIGNELPDKIQEEVRGSGIPYIVLNMLTDLAIPFPSHEEQYAIGVYFQQLDNLITLHQRKYFYKFTSAGTIRTFQNTNAWEQRKLGEMGQTYTGLSGKTKDDFGHGQARFVTYMNVFSNPISNPEMTEPIEIDPKQNEVEVGDVFFTTSSETPEEVGMSSILLEKRGKTYLNSFCFGFRPSEKIDSYYLAYMLRSESARAKITLLAQGISRYNISKNKVMEIAVSLPSLDEQKMIGQYFSQLDNLITLHQRKGKAAVSGCFLNCSSLEKSSAQSRTLELFGQASNQEIKYIIDGLSILGGKLRNFCVKLIILLSYTRINDIAKYHISRNTECVHNIN